MLYLNRYSSKTSTSWGTETAILNERYQKDIYSLNKLIDKLSKRSNIEISDDDLKKLLLTRNKEGRTPPSPPGLNRKDSKY